MKRQLCAGLLVALLVGLAGYGTVLAQDKTLVWERYDVNLTVQPNSDILVEEIQQIAFTSGTFRFGFAAIPLDRLERITDVKVSEITAGGGERAYTPNSQNEFGFTTATNEGNLEITWYFPPTRNSQHTYVLRYRVIGGLRFYDDGDQIWWKAIPPDHNFPIRSTRVTVTPPATFPRTELVDHAYGAPIEGASYTDRGAVVFTARNIPAGEELEVRVQFPHGVVEGSAPAWQAAFDRRQEWGPIAGLLSGALGLILLFGGPVVVYLLWYTRGRDLDSQPGPEYVAEPPSELPAGLVGTLIDEQADMKDIIATILDLAERGALRMEEQKKDTFFGFGVSREFTFHLEDESKALYPHEKRLLLRIFGPNARPGKTCKLHDLRQKFYTAIPDLRRMLYDQVVEQGFFPNNPESTRQRWRWLAVFGLIISGATAFCSLALFGDYSAAVVCPALALAASMLALIFVSRHMPRKTPEGAEEAAKWLAFKRYLEKIEEFDDLETVKDKFEQYLPYAMAFGLERRLIHKFSAIDTPAPRWWGPVVPYGHYPGHHMGRSVVSEGAGGAPGPLAGEGGGMPSLSGMSESIGTSLSSMSEGLGSLLSSASSTFTSRPSSSSSGGFGGGFGGGGSFGGGGGGGGSRGFG